jgi:hypothetical protein
VLELSAAVSVNAVVIDAVGLPSCVAVSALLVSEMAATVVVVVVSATPVTDATAVDAVAVRVKKLKSLVFPAPTPTAGTLPSSEPLPVDTADGSVLELVPVTAAALPVSETASVVVVVVVEGISDTVAVGVALATAVWVKKLKSLVFPAPTPTAGTFPSSEPFPAGAAAGSIVELVSAAATGSAGSVGACRLFGLL